jgi:hypothetical protein
MEITEKITLDMLTPESVSVLKQKFIEIDGVQTQVGSNVRNAYVNSTEGRELLKSALPSEYYNAVIAVWGDTPTVNKESEEK